jgi:hypothetical protein
MKELTPLELAENKINELQAEVSRLNERLRMANSIGNENARQLANIRNAIGFCGDSYQQRIKFCRNIRKEFFQGVDQSQVTPNMQAHCLGLIKGLVKASTIAWAEHKGNENASHS